jgi:tRNA G18 (ribose-2'-O)-methylase SpoU
VIVETVDDPTDPRLADYTALTDAEHRRRYEETAGCFIVEGDLAIRALLASDWPVRSLLLTPARLAALGPIEGDTPVYVAELDVLRAVAGFNLHRGAVASAARRPRPAVADVVHGATRLAVVEAVNDHENLGALFRNAAALGVDGVLLDPRCADPLYRRAVRVSVGNVLRVPFSRVDQWPAGLDALKAAGFTVIALTPAPDAAPLDALAAAPPTRVAFLVGAEGPGLTEAALAAADIRAGIPMADGVDSLNVATAAAVAFYALRPGAR